MMKHKDYLKELKKKDLITYYEITGNPTGVDSEDSGEGWLVIIVFIIFAVFFYTIR